MSRSGPICVFAVTYRSRGQLVLPRRQLSLLIAAIGAAGRVGVIQCHAEIVHGLVRVVHAQRALTGRAQDLARPLGIDKITGVPVVRRGLEHVGAIKRGGEC